MTALQPQPEGIPVPRPSRVSQPYWDGCVAGELRYQRCRDCSAVVFQPSYVCSNCTSRNLGWEVSDGRGRLYSWTVVWRPQTRAFEVPYAVAIIDMDEGYQLLSSIIDCDTDALAKDLRVQVDFREMSDTITLPYFRPID